jgi:hypothetical protein
MGKREPSQTPAPRFKAHLACETRKKNATSNGPSSHASTPRSRRLGSLLTNDPAWMFGRSRRSRRSCGLEAAPLDKLMEDEPAIEDLKTRSLAKHRCVRPNIAAMPQCACADDLDRCGAMTPSRR